MTFLNASQFKQLNQGFLKFIKINIFLTGVLLLSCCHMQSLQQSTISAFDAPDQVLWHAKSDSWFVSNLGGGISLAEDGYGWITRLNKDGEVIAAQWLRGLDAPSGMTSTDDKLFICDRKGVIQVDIKSNNIDEVFLMPDAEFINDVVISPAGDLYVSDFFGNTIYKIPANTRKPEVFVEIENSPDGLYFDGNTLIVVTWGKDVDRQSFKTTENGTMLVVDLTSRKVKHFSENVGNIGNLEGVTKSSDGDFYVTDWMNGKLLKVSAEGVEEVLTGLKNPTDPDYSKELNIIAFPEHSGNRVIFYHL